jgi:DNA-binding NarL/FixJ family response regulator
MLTQSHILTTVHTDSSRDDISRQECHCVGVMGKIRVLLADDHAAMLDGVRAVLGDEFDIVGTVNNGRDALVETRRLDPDVLVLDISMPGLNGLQAANELRSAHRRTKVVFLTVHEDPDFVAAAFSAGASAYVIKSDVATDLVPAIHDALEGRRYISQAISS